MKNSCNPVHRPKLFTRGLVMGALLCAGACERDLTVYASANPPVGAVAAPSDGGDPEAGGVGASGATIASGAYFSCAIVDGGAQCWGDNEVGQLGNGSTANSSVPVQVVGLEAGVQSIAASNADHVCALVDGGILCWGNNANGQLGNGATTNSAAPVQVQGLPSGVEAITVGTHHSCALANGRAWCWGMNYYGQLGGSSGDSPVPVQVLDAARIPLAGVQAIAGGGFHTCAVVNGGAWCWGSNGPVSSPAVYGALGDDYNSGSQSSYPVPVQGLASGVQSIVAGFYFSCALALSGVGQSGVWCWGDNRAGQLGAACTGTYCLAPVPLIGLSGVVEIDRGRGHDRLRDRRRRRLLLGLRQRSPQLGATGANSSCTIGSGAISCGVRRCPSRTSRPVSSRSPSAPRTTARSPAEAPFLGDNRYGEAGDRFHQRDTHAGPCRRPLSVRARAVHELAPIVSDNNAAWVNALRMQAVSVARRLFLRALAQTLYLPS